MRGFPRVSDEGVPQIGCLVQWQKRKNCIFVQHLQLHSCLDYIYAYAYIIFEIPLTALGSIFQYIMEA